MITRSNAYGWIDAEVKSNNQILLYVSFRLIEGKQDWFPHQRCTHANKCIFILHTTIYRKFRCDVIHVPLKPLSTPRLVAINNHNKYSKLKFNISIFKTILEHRVSNSFPEHLSFNLIRAVTVSMWDDNSWYLKESRILSYNYIYIYILSSSILHICVHVPKSQATHLKGIGTPAATANNDCTVPPPKICFLPNETGPDPIVRSSQFSSTCNHIISYCRSFGQPIKLLQTNKASRIERVLGWQNEWSPHQSQGFVPSTSSDTRD